MKANSWVFGMSLNILHLLSFYYIYYKHEIEDENSKEITLVNKVKSVESTSNMYKEEPTDARDQKVKIMRRTKYAYYLYQFLDIFFVMAL